MATEKSSKAEDNKSAIHIIEDDAENTTSSSDANLLTSNLPMVLSGTGFPWDNKWTHSATRTLLELYVKNEEKFKDPHTKKKQIWGEISEILRSKGFTFDAEKCERKFLNLKTVYRNNVQHNCMTGNHDRKCSFYEELDAIFHLSKKLNSSKKSDSKLPDVVEPKRTAHRNPSTDTVTSSAKAAPVPVMLIPNNGGKVSNEAEKSLTSGLSPTSVSSPHNPRVSINPLAQDTRSIIQSNSMQISLRGINFFRSVFRNPCPTIRQTDKLHQNLQTVPNPFKTSLPQEQRLSIFVARLQTLQNEA